MPVTLPIKSVDVNKFWDKTPTPLKYLLVVTLIIATAYFIFMKKVYTNQTEQINQLVDNAKTTYELVDNFNEFKVSQNNYNKEFTLYINNLYTLVRELNETMKKQSIMILGSNTNNKEEIIEKLNMLNESFTKLSTVYQELSKSSLNNKNTNNINNLQPYYDPYSDPKVVNKKTGEIIDLKK